MEKMPNNPKNFETPPSLENIEKDFENLTKIEKLERQDIEPQLDKTLEILQNEPENIRPKDKNNNPGALVELKKDIPTILIPDLHGQREILYKILTTKNKEGKTNLERFINAEVQIVVLGDAVHTETRLDEQQEAQEKLKQNNKQEASQLLDKEIADSFGTVMMLMKLKELNPENFHYLRGDHEVQKETYASVGKLHHGPVLQSSLVKFYFENQYGKDFLDKYDKFEDSLPVLAIGNKFVASHTPHAIPFTKEEIINFYASPPKGLPKDELWDLFMMPKTANSLIPDGAATIINKHPEMKQEIKSYFKNSSESVKNMFKALGENEEIYFFGHDEQGWSWDETNHLCGLNANNALFFVFAEIKTPDELIINYWVTRENLKPQHSLHPKSFKSMAPQNIKVNVVELGKYQTKPPSTPSQPSLPKQKEEKKGKKSESEEVAAEKKELEQEQKEPKKQKEKKKIQEYTPEEIKEHFLEELEKIKDLPNNTEIQKQTIYKESLKLIKDWLPFGYLDDFQGIDELMEFMDKNRPKLIPTYNYRKEKLAQKVALEMAFQYKFWEKSDKEKTETISAHIDKWLKEKSYYYQGAENYKDYLLKPPEKYLKQREQYGYFAGEKIEEPDKFDQRFAKETSTLLKLLGERDRTLKQVCEILAMEGVPYTKEIKEMQDGKEIQLEVGIRALYNQIENQNIKRTTGPKLRKIEEMTKEERFELFAKTKKELGVFPELPLKLDYYESLVSSIMEKDPEKAELAAICALEISDKVNQPESEAKLKQVKDKIQEVIDKNKKQMASNPEAVKNAKEHLKKKGGFWETAAGLAGYGLLLFLILFLLGEIKLGEKITGAGILQKK